jgi:N-acetylmuramoyl-L-alanine amidase
VAYGRPNRWHPQAHRGRKRCGMLMATSSVRRSLGLINKPSYDPDVKAGRLVVADSELARVLFGRDANVKTVARATPVPQTSPPKPSGTAVISRNTESEIISATRSAWDIARERYNTAEVQYLFPDGKSLRGDQVTDWSKIPRGTRVSFQAMDTESESGEERVQTIGKDGNNAYEIAGDAFPKEETIYFLTNGQVKTGNALTREQLDKLPKGTRMLVGYKQIGTISATKRAYDLCGPRWNLATTFYRLPDGSIRDGTEMNEKSILSRTLVFVPR